MTENRTVKILGIAGSLRAKSYNRALLLAAQELTPSDLVIEVFDEVGTLPLFNQDLETEGDPEPVARLKEAIRRNQGLLISTPEYNLSVPGVVKNLVDWASRPARESPLDGTPVGLMGATPGSTGTARAQSVLRQSFVFTNSPVLAQPEVLVGRARDRFDDEGRLTDDRTRDHLSRFLKALRDWVRLVGRKA